MENEVPRLKIELETDEEIKPADTDYLRKHNIKSVGHRKIINMQEVEDGIEICAGSAMRYYFYDKDKEPEEPPGHATCVKVPLEFLPQLKEIVASRENPKGRRPAIVFALEKARNQYDRGLLLKEDVISDLLTVIETDKELEDVKRLVKDW